MSFLIDRQRLDAIHNIVHDRSTRREMEFDSEAKKRTQTAEEAQETYFIDSENRHVSDRKRIHKSNNAVLKYSAKSKCSQQVHSRKAVVYTPYTRVARSS